MIFHFDSMFDHPFAGPMPILVTRALVTAVQLLTYFPHCVPRRPNQLDRQILFLYLHYLNVENQNLQREKPKNQRIALAVRSAYG